VSLQEAGAMRARLICNSRARADFEVGMLLRSAEGQPGLSGFFKWNL
jgi:hypothetical protein